MALQLPQEMKGLLALLALSPVLQAAR